MLYLVIKVCRKGIWDCGLIGSHALLHVMFGGGGRGHGGKFLHLPLRLGAYCKITHNIPLCHMYDSSRSFPTGESS
jgi:hypothetical protein